MADKKILAVGASAMAVGHDPSRGLVGAMFDLPQSLTHLVEDLSLAVQLSPTEARQLAGMLTRKADKTGGTHSAVDGGNDVFAAVHTDSDD